MAVRPKMKAPQMWDAEQYWLKAKVYFDRMEAARGGSADAALFAALSLEYFARAALCSLHPALNADPQEEGSHIMFALGLASPKLPKTIPIHAVYGRLLRVFPQVFTKDHHDHTEYLTKLRNEEMHTAALPFETLPETQWLAGYYDIVLAIMKTLGRKGTDLFSSTKAAAAARALVKTRRDKRIGDVKKRIADCKKAFESLDKNEQALRRTASEQRVRFQHPSAVSACPACTSKVLLRGTLLQVAEPDLVGEELLSEARYATDRVACPACKLRLRGATEVSVAELPPRFHEMQAYDLHESRDEEDDDEYDNM